MFFNASITFWWMVFTAQYVNIGKPEPVYLQVYRIGFSLKMAVLSMLNVLEMLICCENGG